MAYAELDTWYPDKALKVALLPVSVLEIVHVVPGRHLGPLGVFRCSVAQTSQPRKGGWASLEVHQIRAPVTLVELPGVDGWIAAQLLPEAEKRKTRLLGSIESSIES